MLCITSVFMGIVHTQNVMGKDGHNRGEKWYGPNRSRIYHEDVERIHKRATWKKNLHDPDNHDGMITHLELDILEC